MKYYLIIFSFLSISQVSFSRLQIILNDSLKYESPSSDNPNKYFTKDFTFESDNDIILFGTQFIPKKNKKAICLFLHTIGAQDRDETLENTKIFKDIAKGLAVKQIASYSYDKRTYTYPQKRNFTIQTETINDVLALIKYIQSDSSNKNTPVYIIAHGFGCMLAPKIAEMTDQRISGIISLSAIARPLEEMLFDQFTYLAKKDGIITDLEEETLENFAKKVDYLQHFLTDSTSSENLPLAIPASYWISLKEYNQLETIKELKTPMLFLYGNNPQLTNEQDILRWKKNTDQKHTVFLSFDKLNENFIVIFKKADLSKKKRMCIKVLLILL